MIIDGNRIKPISLWSIINNSKIRTYTKFHQVIPTKIFGKNNYHKIKFAKYTKAEDQAYENCDFAGDENHYKRSWYINHLLIGVRKQWKKNCVLCGRLGLIWNIVNVSIMTKILPDENECFRCLLIGYTIKRLC